MKQLEIRCKLISRLFEELGRSSGRSVKEWSVSDFRKRHPKIEKDLDFCFEVLAGKHKLGYTAAFYSSENWDLNGEGDLTIRKFYDRLKTEDYSLGAIIEKNAMCSFSIADFMEALVNRTFKLGYSNKEAMITNLSPMLAKRYPDDHRQQFYYVQEKLDGNRCIAYFLDGSWYFKSRSGKPLNVNFDMSWANTTMVFDGEVMTLAKAGSRDFNRTSGAINGKYTDKSGLHYFIYDIVDDTSSYKDRLSVLTLYDGSCGNDCSILPVLDKIYVYPNVDYNGLLDQYLDDIVSKGGEGIILRDPDAVYQHKRTNALLKYKKLKTMDLRIVGWNYGKENGKYENNIGSFECESDEGDIHVNVSGLSDAIHFDKNPERWLGKIIEVAYFDESKSKRSDITSLRFPRFKRVRDDKDKTSIY